MLIACYYWMCYFFVIHNVFCFFYITLGLMMTKKTIHAVITKLAISLERQKQTEAAPSRQSAIATLRRENLIRLIIFSDSLAIRPLIIKAIAASSLHEAAFSRASIMPYQSMNMIDGYECHYIEIEFLYNLIIFSRQVFSSQLNFQALSCPSSLLDTRKVLLSSYQSCWKL